MAIRNCRIEGWATESGLGRGAQNRVKNRFRVGSEPVPVLVTSSRTGSRENRFGSYPVLPGSYRKLLDPMYPVPVRVQTGSVKTGS